MKILLALAALTLLCITGARANDTFVLGVENSNVQISACILEADADNFASHVEKYGYGSLAWSRLAEESRCFDLAGTLRITEVRRQIYDKGLGMHFWYVKFDLRFHDSWVPLYGFTNTPPQRGDGSL